MFFKQRLITTFFTVYKAIEKIEKVVQPKPQPNERPSIHDLVIIDLITSDYKSGEQVDDLNLRVAYQIWCRKQKGLDAYGMPLQAYNGRNAKQDCLEELLDALVYTRQIVEENKDDEKWQLFYQAILYTLLEFFAIDGQ